jgi:hypothetical protein
VLASCLVDSSAMQQLAAFCAAERLSADRAALAMTGDLRAGLRALCPPEATTIGARLAALKGGPLRELLAFAESLFG